MWIPVACLWAPAGHSGWGSAQSPSLRTHRLFPQRSLVQVWYPPLPTLGVELINILSLFHFSALPAFLPFSLPKRLGAAVAT